MRNSIGGCLFFAACVLSIFAGRVSASETRTDDGVVLKVWQIPPVSSTHPEEAGRVRVYEAFRRAHPNIRLEAVSMMRIEGSAAEGNEYLALAGGMAPDVFYLFGRKVGDYVQQRFVMPLEPLLQNDPEYAHRPYTGLWAPHNIWEAAILPDATGREHLWGIPAMHYVMSLLYRHDILAGKGLLRAPRNWEELYQWARAATWDPAREPGASPDAPRVFGLSLAPPHGGGGWFLLQYIWSAGGQIVRPYVKVKGGGLAPWGRPRLPFEEFRIGVSDPTHYEARLRKAEEQQAALRAQGVEVDASAPPVWRLAIDDAAGKSALEFQKRLTFSRWVRCQNRKDARHLVEGTFLEFDVAEGDLRKGEATCPQCNHRYDLKTEAGKRLVYQGVVRRAGEMEEQFRDDFAMWITTFEHIPSVSGIAKAQLAPFPSKDGGPTVSFTAGHYYCLNAALRKNPRQLAAAWEFIKFMTSDEALRIQTETCVEMGFGAWVRPDLLQKFGFRDAYERQTPAFRAAMTQAAANTEVEPYAKGFYHIMVERFGVMLERALASPDSDVAAILRETTKECNERILGEPPVAELRRKERVGWALVAIMGAAIAVSFRKIVKLFLKGETTASVEGFGVRERGWRRELRAWLFLAPALASILLWSYYPLARGTLMAFQDVQLLGDSTWVGLKHFVDVFSEPRFYQYLFQTAYYVVLSLALGFLAPLFLAVLLSEIPKGKIIFRTIYYLPSVTTGLVVMFLWKQLVYDPAPSGLLNQVGACFGLSPQQWLQDPLWAMFCVILPTIWSGVGAGSLIYLAALKGIPDEQFEAADLDGAGPWRKFIHVMLPNLHALLVINLVGAVVGAFQASQSIFVMTAGGPQERTMTVGLDIWFKSFLYLNFGYATAEAWVLGALLIGFTLMQLRVLNKLQFKKAAD